MLKYQKDVKLSKKMSNVKKSNMWTMEELHTHQKGNCQMRFTYIDVNFDVTYEGCQNKSKILSMDILIVFGHHHM